MTGQHCRVILTLGLLLSACAGGPGDGSAPAAQAAAPSNFDGTWRGSGRLNPGSSFNCGAPELTRTMEVRGGTARLDYEIRTNTVFSGTVGADGTLQMQSGNRTFRGRFAGDSFTGQYFHQTCPREWSMQRVAAAPR